MTYQQVWNSMSKREKRANDIMCMFKVKDDGHWDEHSIRNKILYRVTKLVLGGRDPLDMVGYYASQLDESLYDETYPQLMAELYSLKQAWK